jgi:hypothetical protein
MENEIEKTSTGGKGGNMSDTAVVQAILETCHDQGIVLSVAGEKLSIDAPEGAVSSDLLDGLRQHKAILLDILRNDKNEPEMAHYIGESSPPTPPSIATDVDIVSWDGCPEPPDPCPKCGSLMLWWNLLGRQYCMICEKPAYPLEKAAKLRELAKNLRQFPKKGVFSGKPLTSPAIDRN